MRLSLCYPVLDGIPYFVHPQQLVIGAPVTSNAILAVVTTISDAIRSIDESLKLIDRFSSFDDVYSKPFAHTVILQLSPDTGDGLFDDILTKFKESGCFDAVYCTITTSASVPDPIPSGPYFLVDGGLHQAYRLYEDELDSFIFGVIPDDVLNSKKYSVVPCLGPDGLRKTIVVPSRLYAKPTPDKPLADARMGIKDIFCLNGTKLTMISRPPSSSSAGAGTSLAGYDWLDFFIAGDYIKFDVVGHFGRNLDDFNYIVSHTFENIQKSFTGFSSKLLCPSKFHPLPNAKQQALNEEFIGNFENFLGVRRTPFSIAEEWEKNPPAKARGAPLFKYTEKSAFWALCYDYYHRFGEFLNDYKAKFGKDAYVSSVVQYRWDNTYLEELVVFRDWFTKFIMGPDSKTLSNAILIMPSGKPDPEYWDDPNPISGRNEVRPIASSLIGAKGSDLMLIKLATKTFRKASWPTTIQTGRYMYPLADNSRNVGLAPVTISAMRIDVGRSRR
ncbi:hypothetical protein QBC38DRAFT_511972 [Podospora fimiseda]|uniref:Amidase domain-containing protein n=1 Tax=Podospora fimiseda TaxID=252190 RepID=A0AAN7GQ33_9PEZI|nr:hypothetical protein QBC38DRAFT_511972 [Podospora fimiseda]